VKRTNQQEGPQPFFEDLSKIPPLQEFPPLESEQEGLPQGIVATMTFTLTPIVSLKQKGRRVPTPKQKAKLRDFFAWMLSMRALKAYLPQSVRIECAQNGNVRIIH